MMRSQSSCTSEYPMRSSWTMSTPVELILLLYNDRTLSQFHGEDIYLSSLFHGIGIFLLSFSISMALGVFFGLMCSLGLKHSNLALFPHIESCIVSLVAYCAYFFSNGLSMSGA